MLDARGDLAAARDDLDDLRGDLRVLELVDGDGRDEIAAIRDDLEATVRQLRSPLVAPMRALPVLGRQTRSAAALADGVATALDTGLRTLERVDAVVVDGFGTGADRAGRLRDISAIAADAHDDVASIDLGPSSALIGPLADARDELGAELGELQDGLRRAEEATAGLAALLTGERRFLVLAANNAQMQNGSGMLLSSAVLDVSDGRLSLGPVTPAEELPLPSPPVELEPDLAATWAMLDPNHDWRHLGSTARFEVTGATALDLWDATGHEPVEGVLAIDPVALAALLEATGPVVVDGRRLDHDNLLPYLLHDQYVEAFGAGGGDPGAQSARRDRLAVVARAVIEALDTTDIDIGAFEPLADAVAGRHLLAWSPDDLLQTGFSASGAAGELPRDGLMVGLLNRSGVKLDWFIDAEVDLDRADTDDGTRVTMRVEVTNRVAVEGEPTYVVGPYPRSGLAAGEYLGVLAVTLPGYVADLRAGDDDEVLLSGPDGDHHTVGLRVQVGAGATTTIELAFTVPAGVRELTILPSARARPITFRDGQRELDDRRARAWRW